LKPRPLLGGLTSIRFLAALHVLFAHFDRAPPILKVDIGPSSAAFSTFASGAYWAVSAFFVLSGFVLVYSYADRPLAERAARREFWYGRFARLYPAYAVSLVVLAPQFFLFRIGHEAVDWEGKHHGLVALLVPTLLQTWVPGAAEAWNGVAWTLSVDVACYVVFPFLLGPMLRAGAGRLRAVIALSWIVMLVVPIGYLVLAPDGVRTFDGPGRHGSLFWLAAVRYHPLARFPEFLIGMAVGCLFLRRKPGPADGSDRMGSTLVVFALLSIVATALVTQRLPVPLWHSGLLPIASAALVYGLATRPRWTRGLEWSPLVRLGDATYGFYLFHVPIIASTLMTFGRLSAPFPGSRWLLLTVAIGIATMVAFVVQRVVEVPARKWLLARYRERRPAA
jgi:peptidoglycan/LPS O-acetylase OafA/YrhL